MYTLKGARATKFYDDHPDLDFETMNLVLIDFLEPIIENLTAVTSNSRNTQLLGDIVSKLEQFGESQTNQSYAMKGLEAMLDNLKTRFSEFTTQMDNNVQATLGRQRDSLIDSVKATLNTSREEKDKTMLSQMEKEHELLFSRFVVKLTEIPKDISLGQEQLKSLVTESIQNLTGSVMSHVKDRSDISTQINDLIGQNYDKFSAQVQSKMESVVTTSTAMFGEITEKLSDTKELLKYVRGQATSSVKGKQGENKLEAILWEMFPHATVTNSSKKKASGDFIVERNDKEKILIDTKEYSSKSGSQVGEGEVGKIIRDTENHNCHGILLSQTSGIAGKANFQIDIHKNNVIVYVHNAQYEPTKILMAVQVIDHLSESIREHISSDAPISMETLNDFKKEYEQLVCQKDILIDSVKKYSQDIVTQVEQFELPSLFKALSAKFSMVSALSHICKTCSCAFKNKRSLAKHQTYCKKRSAQNQNTEEVVIAQ